MDITQQFRRLDVYAKPEITKLCEAIALRADTRAASRLYGAVLVRALITLFKRTTKQEIRQDVQSWLNGGDAIVTFQMCCDALDVEIWVMQAAISVVLDAATQEREKQGKKED